MGGISTSQSDPGLEFDFGLQPILQLTAGCTAASFEHFLRTPPDLFRCGRWRFGLRCGLFHLVVRLRSRVFGWSFHFDPGFDLFSLCFPIVSGRSEGPVAAAFRQDGPEAEEERGEHDDHKAPDPEHLPVFPMNGSVQERGAVAGSPD